MPLAAHGVTHTGRRRTNEDSMLIDLELRLFIVADGMGGHNAGEVASALAVRTIRDFIAEEGAPTERALIDVLCLANEQVLSAAAAEPNYAGMGTTVVAACVVDDQLLFGNVGDSRIYFWRDGTLTQLTTDDSWLSRVLPDEALSPEDVQRHPMRHVLTKVVGLREDMDPAVGTSEFKHGDVLLLCSDGLHGTVADDQLAEALGSGASVQQIAERLVQEAMTGGATDNVTAVVVRRE